MKVSVIVATKNRAYALAPCLNSIGAALTKAKPLEAELIVVDNGSTDDTQTVLTAWASANPGYLVALREPRPGKSCALNRALQFARGELLAFLDDDCRAHPEYVNDLLRHDANDHDELVLRGGRIELGDQTDLPLTINTTPTRVRWSRASNSARHQAIWGKINGCNMAMRRGVIELIGGFDEDFGPGSKMGSGDDTEFMFRAYTAGVPIEYVPDMAVSHYHGRKNTEDGFKLWRSYAIGNGGIIVKFIFEHFNLSRPLWWDLKNAVTELRTGTNKFDPETNVFSYVDKVHYQIRGILRYIFMRRKGIPAMNSAAERTSSA
jgi:glycosyltransferase involved in cell wall biosynthesis